MLQVLGALCLVAAVAGFIMYMRTSYVTQGGGLGQVPCVAAATIQVPLMTMLGLALLNTATGQFDFPWWQWLLIWFAETVLVALATSWIGDVACRKSRAGRPDPQAQAQAQAKGG